MKHKSLTVLLAMMIVVTALFFPGGLLPGVQNAAAQNVQTLRLGLTQAPSSLTYYYAVTKHGLWATSLLQSNLFDINDSGIPVPVLVSTIPVASKTSVTIKLKDKLKWSDGAPLNADDLVFTYHMLLDPANGFQINLRPVVASVTKIDALTVRLNLARPADVREVAGPGQFVPLPAHIYQPIYAQDKTLEKVVPAQQPTVFSGPYMLKTWIPGESMTLEVNPNYSSAKPSIQTIEARFFSDRPAARQALVDQKIDFVVLLEPIESVRLQGLTKTASVMTLPLPGEAMALWLNVRTEKTPKAGHLALQDKQVRQAIRLAINRRRLAKDVLNNTVQVSEGFRSGLNLKFVESDPKAADILLDAAGWKKGPDGSRQKDGVSLNLRLMSLVSEEREIVLKEIQADLDQVGIKSMVQTVDSGKFFANYKNAGTLATGDFDIAIFGSGLGSDNFGCSQISSEQNSGGQNYTGFCSPDLEALAQFPILQQGGMNLDKIVDDEVPVIVLYQIPELYAYSTARFTQRPRVALSMSNSWFDIAHWRLK